MRDKWWTYIFSDSTVTVPAIFKSALSISFARSPASNSNSSTFEYDGTSANRLLSFYKAH